MASLTLLLPELRRIGMSGASPLPQWLSRGDELASSQAGREIALRECFKFLGSSFPHAALSRSIESGDASAALWLNADPAYVIADAVTVRMLACGSMGLMPDESSAMAKSLQPLFGDVGFPLDVSPSGRWQLRCPKESRLPVFAPPSLVVGDDLARHLPSGDNERQWRHLLNEAQVILHNHPVNARRVHEGKAPANSVWFWGAGTLPEWVRTRFSRVVSDDDEVMALAKLAGRVATDASFDAGNIKSGDEVLFDAGENPSQQIDAYLSNVQEALRRGIVRHVGLVSNDGSRYIYKSSHRWRWWRRIRAVPAK
ncbi:MAG TPA: phosphoglycerate mutase [Rudaea sp.]|nr:phosphoglycerate mutase [Rudaea sp.]